MRVLWNVSALGKIYIAHLLLRQSAPFARQSASPQRLIIAALSFFPFSANLLEATFNAGKSRLKHYIFELFSYVKSKPVD